MAAGSSFQITAVKCTFLFKVVLPYPEKIAKQQKESYSHQGIKDDGVDSFVISELKIKPGGSAGHQPQQTPGNSINDSQKKLFDLRVPSLLHSYRLKWKGTLFQKFEILCLTYQQALKIRRISVKNIEINRVSNAIYPSFIAMLPENPSPADAGLLGLIIMRYP